MSFLIILFFFFLLQSKGRTESILMSLPAVAHWRYCYAPAPGSPEQKVVLFYLKPQDWANMQVCVYTTLYLSSSFLVTPAPKRVRCFF